MEYWRRLQAAIPAYRIDRTRTNRETPIVLLQPAKPAAPGWETQPINRTPGQIS